MGLFAFLQTCFEFVCAISPLEIPLMTNLPNNQEKYPRTIDPITNLTICMLKG